MRSLAVRSLLAALVLIALTGCEPMSTHGVGQVHCNVMLDPPTRDNPQTPHTIVSQVRYWCENPGADQLSLTLRMQKLNPKGTWVNVASSSFTVRGNQTVRTDDDRYRSRTISIRCAAGDYRTVVTGRSSGSNTRTADYDLTGSRAADPCTPALQFQ